MPAKKKCAVSHCDHNSIDNPGLLFHRFPAKRERSSSWRALCANPSLSAVPADELGLRWLFVCSSHFHENDYTNALRNRLNGNAFPTLFLPQQDLETSTDNNEGISVPHVSSAPSTSTLPCDSLVENVSDSFLTSTPMLIPDSVPHTAEPSLSVPSVTPIASTSVECSLPSPSTSSAILETPTRSTSSLRQHDPSTPTMSASRRVPMTSGSRSRKGPRFSLLESINLTSAVDFTPRKKKLVSVIRSQRKSISKFRRMSIAIRRKYQNILKFRGDTFVEHLEQNLPTSFTQFLRTQLRIAGKKPKGRRWTNEEKIMALPLYKKSPKAYALLRTFVSLPSKRTLNSLLQQVPFSTGVHTDLVSHLSFHVSEMAEEDKFCTLLFDEMSVKPHLFFDSHHDRIDGFEDLGKGGKSNKVAKYALVFMVRALFSNWKQPVAYYFSHNSTSALTISTMLKEIVPLIISSGLKVMATVCDMGTNNVRALKLLGASFQSPFFSIGDTKIFTVFDPPHLLKCFRNLFLMHDVEIGVEVGGNTINRVAKWQHILTTYADQDPPFHDLKRLTKRHLDPKHRDKMRVFLAAQVMSNTVACAVNHRVSSGVLGSDGVATATFILLCDEIFDSLNGSLKPRDRHKVLKGPVTSSSPHFQFWETAIKRIDSLKFLSCGRRPPSQDGWLATIRAVRMLWKVVRKEGFHHLESRKLNQDPLENLFGIIRQNCGQNHHPNVPQFVSALKTALIDGFSAPSTKHNCELDEDNFLSNLKSFLEKGLGSSASERDSASETSAIAYSKMQDRFFQTSLEGIRVQSIAYVSSYICQRLVKDSSCNDCKSSITSDFLFSCNILTSFHDVDYESGQFPLPSEEMVAAMVHGTNILESVMPRVAHTDNVCQQLTTAILHSVDFSFIKCLPHRDKLKQEMSLFLSQIFAYRYCKNVNSSLESPP